MLSDMSLNHGLAGDEVMGTTVDHGRVRRNHRCCIYDEKIIPAGLRFLNLLEC